MVDKILIWPKLYNLKLISSGAVYLHWYVIIWFSRYSRNEKIFSFNCKDMEGENDFF